MKMVQRICVFAVLTIGVVLAQGNAARMAKEVRHELVMLPYLDVFDNLAYKVEGAP
jgi:hypothetical protein